ncbi:hypothetical protein [uncultured Bacteroides sp.]|uniref:hypothetical protein n=1 Tax=uncultured Bacteroides sp. TaxID=162156 RepID=UPI002AABF083|nr:hypothetical protein [uncultured Bacteroides sp.]
METFKKGMVNLMGELLAVVNVAQMSSTGRVAITRNFMAAKKVAKEIAEARKEASEKLLTEEFQELMQKEEKTEEEKARFAELENMINAEGAEILNPILDEEVEIDIKKISEEDFDKIIEGTESMNLAQLDFLHELIVE